MKIITVHIGQEIKKRLDDSKMTQKEFGFKIGVPQSNLNRIFNKESIETAKLIKISEVLDFNFFNLYTQNQDTTITTKGDFSPATKDSEFTMIVGDAVLAERIKAKDAIIAEKDERIKELKERIEELKAK